MAEVLPLPLDGYYQAPSPRCHSPQPPYTASYESSIPRSHSDSYDDFSSFEEPSPAVSSMCSSPELSSLLYSTRSSGVSSAASSVCLDTRSSVSDTDDPLLLPVYNHEISSLHERSDGCYNLPTEDVSVSRAVLGCKPASPTPAELIPPPADDSFVTHEPSRHVDYLSYSWREEDIWASWRYMVGKRKVYSNSARLENASWRTWGKAKYNLKTISPETLNWYASIVIFGRAFTKHL